MQTEMNERDKSCHISLFCLVGDLCNGWRKIYSLCFPEGWGQETALARFHSIMVSGGQTTILRILCRKAGKRIREKMGYYMKHDLIPLLKPSNLYSISLKSQDV